MSPARTRLTRRFYRVLFAVYRALFPTRAPNARLAPASVRRVLVGRTDRVGDTVVFTPALAYLRAVLPHAEIDVVTAAGASLLAGDPRVTRVVTPGRGLGAWWRHARDLRRRHYDLVLSVRLRDHMDEGVTTAFVAGRRGARVTARRPPQYAGFFTRQVRVSPSRRHITQHLLYLAWAAVGEPDAAPPGLADYPAALAGDAGADARAAAFIREACGGAPRPFVAFNAWGSDPKRCFAVEQAGEIAARIAERHPELVVVLTPPPSAAAGAAAMAQAAAARAPAAAARVVVAPPSPDLRRLVALVRRAAVVVTPDTANMHVASAVGAPVLAVYSGYTAVDVWGAWGAQPRRVVFLPGDRPITEVAADAVADAFDSLWSELAAPRATASDPRG